MSKTEWKEYKLGDFAVFNPTEHLSKGSIAKKIAMDKLIPYCRNISNFELEAFSGGTKFRNGDTIMARITPCLENGKISQVRILDEDEIGFGSTEYIVFRAKEGVSDPDFLYYLVTSDIVKEPAIKSMVGSSGRQRVQTDVVQNLKIKVPPLAEQQRIAKILSSLDEKIELNNAINRNLEEQAQAIFKSWFIDFEPFGGEMPKDWSIGKLSDIAEYEKEKISLSELTEETYYSTENMLSNKTGVTYATNLPTIEQTTRCFPGETIISNIRPYFKKIFYCTEDIAGCSTDVLCFKPKNKLLATYNYSLLYSDNFFDHMVKGSKGTKMPRGDKSQIMNYEICIPSDEYIQKFDSIVSKLQMQIQNLKKETTQLTKTRDALLPEFMLGELGC